jgi:hypothetical protein
VITLARDLSILIPSRREEFLSRTIEGILENIEADTEVIAVLDGDWADPPVADHPRVRLIHVGKSIGQRAATNLAARMSTAEYICKLDAHCIISKGFDSALIQDCEPDYTLVPVQYNLHAFDFVCRECGARKYQGPTLKKCEKCQSPRVEREMIWKPRWSRKTESWRFDSELHFQYWGEYKDRPEVKAQGDIHDTMSLLGACWFLRRDRYWQLDGMSEETGSWGQMGVEVALKAWTSLGRCAVSRNAWYAHLFRTQGGDFSFPYPLSGTDQDKARVYSQKLWREGLWPGMKRPVSSVVEQFWPIPGWSQEDLDKLKAIEAPKWGGYGTSTKSLGSTVFPQDVNNGSDMDTRAQQAGERRVAAISSGSSKAAGIIYYSDCRLDERIFTAAQQQLQRSVNGHRIISVTLQKPVPIGDNIVLDRQRGAKSLFLQILAGLERSTADYVFFCEHDCLYPKEAFEFIPPRDDRYYYNIACYKVSAVTGQAVTYKTQQLSGLCANRLLLIEHYHRRLAKMAQNVRDCIRQGIPFKDDGHSRHAGWEPGNHREPRGVDNYKSESWMSSVPYVDIRDHGFNHTKTRWSVAEFRDPRTAEGWTESDEIPGWGVTKNRFWEFLADVTQ